jgi:hypothetical protein
MFGSTARGDARPNSDLDFLVDVEPGLPDRPEARLRLFTNGNGFGEVFPDDSAGDPQLRRDLPRGAAFHQDFMTNDVYVVHPEHPFQRTRSATLRQPAIRPSGGSLSERRMDHFPGGAPKGSGSALQDLATRYYHPNHEPE